MGYEIDCQLQKTWVEQINSNIYAMVILKKKQIK